MANDTIDIVGLAVDSKSVDKGTRSLDKLGKQARKTERATDGLSKSSKRLATNMAAAAAVIAAFAAVKLVTVAREFDIINASLVTVTGSAENAALAFERIQEFAATTPFALKEVADAFIKLKALGLDPSERALLSYGNTASAMGKSLNQMIEAVADASTMEFERLKEFGIKAKQQGDQVSFTFRGVTTTVEKEADAIQGFLLGIGETDFAGAMEQRANSLDGALSNLEDSWDNLFLTLSQSGIGGLFEETARLATDALDAISAFIKGSEEEGLALTMLTLEIQAAEISLEAMEGQTNRNERAINAKTESIVRLNKELENMVNAQVAADEQEAAAGGGEKEEKAKLEAQKRVDFIIAQNQMFRDMAEENRILRLDDESIFIASLAEMADQAQATDEEKAINAFQAELDRIEEHREFLIENMIAFGLTEAEIQAEIDLANEDAEAIHAGKIQAIRNKAEKDRLKAMTESEKLMAAVRDGNVSGSLNSAAKLTAGLAQHNRAAFEANKAFATGQVIVDGVMAIQKAASSLPFPANIPGIAIETLGAATRLAAVQSASFGGGGSIPTSQGGSAGGVPSQQLPQIPDIAQPEEGEKAGGIIMHNTIQVLDPNEVSDDALQALTDRLAAPLKDSLARGQGSA